MTDIITKSIMGLAFALLILAGVSVFGDLLMKDQGERQAMRVAKVLAVKTGGVIGGDQAGKDKGPDMTGMPIEQRLALANVKAGKKQAGKCKSCHTLTKGGANRVGPNLYEVVGRQRAANGDFEYSDAMKAKGGSWTYAELDAFLTKPMEYIPGTKMSFPGLRKEADRAHLIVYLRSLSDLPMPLPEVAMPVVEPTAPAEVAPTEAAPAQ